MQYKFVMNKLDQKTYLVTLLYFKFAFKVIWKQLLIVMFLTN